jgi:hypothetical protein
MKTATRTTPSATWTVDLGAVREAALLIAPDADLVDFFSTASILGVPNDEARCIAEILVQLKNRSHGCI